MLQRERLFQLEQYASFPSEKEERISGVSVDEDDGFLCVLGSGTRVLAGRHPVYKTLPWFKTEDRRLLSAVFSPEGDFLLFLCRDGTLYLSPTKSLIPPPPPPSVGSGGKKEFHRKEWTPKNGRALYPLATPEKGPSKALLWWNYGDFTSAAIIGTTHGEVIVIDLVTARELGRASVSKKSIHKIEVVWDIAMDSYHLIITDEDFKQWRLLLEQRSVGYSWPRSNENKSSSAMASSLSIVDPSPRSTLATRENTLSSSNSIDDLSGPPRSRLAAGLKHMSVSSLASLRQKISEGKKMLDRMGGTAGSSQIGSSTSFGGVCSLPESLSSRVGDAGISVQSRGIGDNPVLAGVHSDSAVLTVLNSELEVMPGKVYKLPRFPKRVLLMSKVILVAGSDSDFSSLSSDEEDDRENVFAEKKGELLHVISYAQAEFQADSSQQNRNDPLIQSFLLSHKEEVLGFHVLRKDKEDSTGFPEEDASSHFEDFGSEVEFRIRALTRKDNLRRLFQDVLVFTTKGIYKLTLRRDPINSFLELSMRGETSLAESVAAAFVLDAKNLLELAGDIRLKDNDCSGAINLYRSAGIKHLKIVLKFSYSGHVAELLNYLSVLFKTPNTDITLSERIHLSNLALMAYFQQVLTKITPSTRFEFRNEIKGFLNSNRHFDETLAVRLAAETKEWDLLSYFSRTRGIRDEVVDAIVKVVQQLIGDNPSDEIGHDRLKLISKSLQDMVSGERNCLLSCLLDPQNLECCSSKINGINLIKILSGSLPLLEEEGLQAVALMCAPENPAFLPFFLQEDTFYASSFLNLFITSLLLLIKKRNSNAVLDSSLMNISCKKETVDDLPRRYQNLHNCKANTLSPGGSHVLLIRQGGTLYSWGYTGHGALGRGTSSENSETMKEVYYFRQNNIKVISVAAGEFHSLALTNFGVYSWGTSKFGQLGHGTRYDQKRPALIHALRDITIVDVAAGRFHSLALDSDGKVWSWGLGVHGQLGLGDIEDALTPQRVLRFKKVQISEISAGYAHSTCLSSDGVVYSFGNNLFGQLGNGTTMKSNYPLKTDISVLCGSEKIVSVTSGFFHNLALTSEGKVLIWGCNPQVLRLEAQSKRRQLSQSMRQNRPTTSMPSQHLSQYQSTSEESQPLSMLRDIKRQAHSALGELIDNKKDITSETKVDKKQLANGRPHVVSNGVKKERESGGVEQEEMVHLKASFVDFDGVEGKIVGFSAGNQHSMLLTDKGTLYGFGTNTQGQLGNNSRVDSKTPCCTVGLSENKIIGVACGMDYTLAMGDNGTVFSWGNNAHAQLGKPPVSDAVSKDAKEKVLVMTNRRIIRLNQKSPDSWDIPKPVLETQPQTDGGAGGSRQYFSRTVLVEFMRIPPKTAYDLRCFEDVPRYLHSTLENFHSFLESKTLIKKCLISENPQAAAKISLLCGNMLQAFEFTLQSIIKHHQSSLHSSSEAVFGAFNFYLSKSATSRGAVTPNGIENHHHNNRDLVSCVDSDDDDKSKRERRHLFERLVACWQDQKWSFVHLEKLILENATPTMLQILVLTLFCPSEERVTDKGPVISQDSGPKLVDLFTPEFCLKIGDIFVNGLKDEDEFWHNEREIQKWLLSQKPNELENLINRRKT